MKLRHLQFRVDAKALSFAFGDPRFFIDPTLDPKSFWRTVKAPGGFETTGIPWAKHVELAARRMMRVGDPLKALRQCAIHLLDAAGPWMSLRPIPGTYSATGDRELGELANELWVSRGSPNGDDWTDWFSAIELLDMQPGDEILRWRWMSLSLPASLFIAAATPQGLTPPTVIRLLDCSIAPSGQVALLHAHIGAMVTFEGLWSRLSERFGPVRDREPDEFRGLRENCPLGAENGHAWIESLRKGFLVRELLHQHTGHSSSLAGCTCCQLSAESRILAFNFITAPLKNIAPRQDYSLHPWTEERCEERFLQRALSQAEHEGGQYELLLTQYIRLKVIVFQYLVADPDLPSLESFVKTCGRSTAYHPRDLGATTLKSDFLNEIGLDMRSAEVRTTPGHWLNGYIGRAPFESDTIESGWVLHFKRGQGPTADPEKTRRTIMKASKARAKEAERLVSVIRAKPEVLRHLRGLDIAALEREGPLWSFIGYLRKVRGESKKASSQCPGLFPLRLAIHAGEDFDHLFSGLRAVHEPFAWHLMERGDRLGHAIALGIDPFQWVAWTHRRYPKIQMRPWDRLLDIGWVSFSIRTFRLAMKTEQRECFERLSAEAICLFNALGWETTYDGELLSTQNAAYMAELFWLGLGLSDPRIDERYPTLRERVPESMLNADYSVVPSQDLPLMGVLREHLATLVARSGVAIEVNPTSNMVVAGLPNMMTQPFFHLRSTEPSHMHVLLLAISSDDPLNFSTCLADEYAYAWAGMVAGGITSANYARAWLDEAASTSMRMRFTLPIDSITTRGNGTGNSNRSPVLKDV